MAVSEIAHDVQGRTADAGRVMAQLVDDGGLVAMSKTAPQLGETVNHVIGPAAQVGVHAKSSCERNFLHPERSGHPSDPFIGQARKPDVRLESLTDELGCPLTLCSIANETEK